MLQKWVLVKQEKNVAMSVWSFLLQFPINISAIYVPHLFHASHPMETNPQLTNSLYLLLQLQLVSWHFS